jgi:hypothetical protein
MSQARPPRFDTNGAIVTITNFFYHSIVSFRKRKDRQRTVAFEYLCDKTNSLEYGVEIRELDPFSGHSSSDAELKKKPLVVRQSCIEDDRKVTHFISPAPFFQHFL